MLVAGVTAGLLAAQVAPRLATTPPTPGNQRGNDHLDRLRSVGVELIYGEEVWPLAELRAAGPRGLPWSAILGAIKSHC